MSESYTQNILHCLSVIAAYPGNPYSDLQLAVQNLLWQPQLNVNLSQEYLTQHQNLILPLLSILMSGLTNSSVLPGLAEPMQNIVENTILAFPWVVQQVTDHVQLLQYHIYDVSPSPDGGIQPDMDAIVPIVRKVFNDAIVLYGTLGYADVKDWPVLKNLDNQIGQAEAMQLIQTMQI